MLRGNRGRGSAPPPRGGRGSFNRAPGSTPLYGGANSFQGSFGSGNLGSGNQNYGGFGGNDDMFYDPPNNRSNFMGGNQGGQHGFQSAPDTSFRAGNQAPNTASLWNSDNTRVSALEDRITEIENRLIAIENSFPAMKREFNDFGAQLAEVKRKASMPQIVPTPSGPMPLVMMGGRTGPAGPGSRLPPGFIPPPVLKGVFDEEVEVAGLVADLFDTINLYTGTLIFDFEGQTYKAIYELKNFKNKDEIKEFARPGGKFVIAAIAQIRPVGLEFEVVGMVPLERFDPSRIEIGKPGFRRELTDMMGNLKVLNSEEAELTVFIRGLPKHFNVKRDKFIVNGTIPDDLTGLSNDRAHCELGKKRTKKGVEYIVLRCWLLGRKRDLEKDEGENVAAKKLCLDKDGWEQIGTFNAKYTPTNPSLCRAKANIGVNEVQEFYFTRGVASYQGAPVSDFLAVKEKQIQLTVEGRKDEAGKIKYRVSSATFPGKDFGRLRFSNVKALFRAITEKKGQAKCNIHGKTMQFDVSEGLLLEAGAAVENYKLFNGRKDMNCEIVKNAEGVYELKRAWFGKLYATKDGKNLSRPVVVSGHMKKLGKDKTRKDKRIYESCVKTATGTFVPTGEKTGVIKFGEKELAVRPPLIWKDQKYLKTFEGEAEMEVTFQYAEIPTDPIQEYVLIAWNGEEPKRQDFVEIYKLKTPKYGEMGQFTRFTDKEGYFDVPEVGEMCVKTGHFFLAGDEVKDLRMVEFEKFCYQISCDEMGNVIPEVPVAWVGKKPLFSEGRERALAEIQEYVHSAGAVCRVLSGKFRNINIQLNVKDMPNEPSLFETTNVYDIVQLEVISNQHHTEFFMGSNWTKIASGLKKEVPDTSVSEPEEDSEPETEVKEEEVDATQEMESSQGEEVAVTVSAKALTDTTLSLSVESTNADISVNREKVELFGIQLADVALDAVFKIGDKFLVDRVTDPESVKFLFDDMNSGKVKLLTKLHEFCAERNVDGALRETLASRLEATNGHAAEPAEVMEE